MDLDAYDVNPLKDKSAFQITMGALVGTKPVTSTKIEMDHG